MTTQPDPTYPVPTANTPTPEQRNYMYVIYGLYALGVISFANHHRRHLGLCDA